MSILAKFAALEAARQQLGEAGRDPFDVLIEPSESAAEGWIEGRRVLLFGTNNYLGLSQHPASREAAAEAALHHGAGATGSRLANGTSSSHRELEAEMAAFYGRRSCMVFTTGYQANLGMLSVLAGKDDHLLIDADSHASIYDGSRLAQEQGARVRHDDPEDLRRRLRRLADAPGSRLVVVEGIYSMLGDSAPLAEIAAVAREDGATLLVDEAHSLGVLGSQGRGLAQAVGVERDVDFIVGTFSKSLGGVGGFCVSNHPSFDILRVACRPYMFTASLPPSVVASVRSALQLLQEFPELRDRLWANARQFYGRLEQAGFILGPQVSPIVSVAMPDVPTAVGFWNMLLDRGVYVNLTLPPATPNGQALLRSSLTAAHEPAQVEAAAGHFVAVATAMGLVPKRTVLPAFAAEAGILV